MTQAARYDRAYRLGQAARSRGIDNINGVIDLYWDEVRHMTHAEMAHIEAGLRGAERPYPVTGWRYGHIPACGRSQNGRDDTYESGVSLMAVDGGAETQDKISAMFIAAGGRPVVKVRGLLHTFRTGADGEPLVLDAVEVD